MFEQSPILRRKISPDVTFGVPAVSPQERPVRSFVAEARRDPPEIPSIACMAPVEIAAGKAQRPNLARAHPKTRHRE